jgi:hypothetical protein
MYHCIFLLKQPWRRFVGIYIGPRLQAAAQTQARQSPASRLFPFAYWLRHPATRIPYFGGYYTSFVGGGELLFFLLLSGLVRPPSAGSENVNHFCADATA